MAYVLSFISTVNVLLPSQALPCGRLAARSQLRFGAPSRILGPGRLSNLRWRSSAADCAGRNSLESPGDACRTLGRTQHRVIMSYSGLVETSKLACDKIAPLIRTLYSSLNSDTSKLKADSSVFTIADGIVQHLLTEHLFTSDKFAAVVGEEGESKVNLKARPYSVDELLVPEEFCETIDAAVRDVQSLASQIDPKAFLQTTVFIDPIDGTREFASGRGEQCTVCIGFSDAAGRPVAGLVYRPIPNPATFAGGCKSENFMTGELDKATPANTRGFLTTNGAISEFIEKLMLELGYQRVPSGGAGNKMLMLLEGKGAAYIQDRGVSRWDTAGAQAVIEAYGGTLSKLTSFENSKQLESYKYLKSDVNLDFEPEMAWLTPYNCRISGAVNKDDKQRAATAESVKPYANLCGLLALDKSCLDQKDSLYDAIQRANKASPPSYD